MEKMHETMHVFMLSCTYISFHVFSPFSDLHMGRVVCMNTGYRCNLSLDVPPLGMRLARLS